MKKSQLESGPVPTLVDQTLVDPTREPWADTLNATPTLTLMKKSQPADEEKSAGKPHVLSCLRLRSVNLRPMTFA
jgi:hypothetical protein